MFDSQNKCFVDLQILLHDYIHVCHLCFTTRDFRWKFLTQVYAVINKNMHVFKWHITELLLHFKFYCNGRKQSL